LWPTWLGRSDAITFFPFAVTLVDDSTVNVTSPFGVVTVSALLAASNLLTVPSAVMTVAFGALAAALPAGPPANAARTGRRPLRPPRDFETSNAWFLLFVNNHRACCL
jgi:hypothetical protein